MIPGCIRFNICAAWSAPMRMKTDCAKLTSLIGQVPEPANQPGLEGAGKDEAQDKLGRAGMNPIVKSVILILCCAACGLAAFVAAHTPERSPGRKQHLTPIKNRELPTPGCIEV